MLIPNANWKQDNARFAVYTFGGALGEKWYDMTYDESLGVYIAVIDNVNPNIIFLFFLSNFRRCFLHV